MAPAPPAARPVQNPEWAGRRREPPRCRHPRAGRHREAQHRRPAGENGDTWPQARGSPAPGDGPLRLIPELQLPWVCLRLRAAGPQVRSTGQGPPRAVWTGRGVTEIQTVNTFVPFHRLLSRDALGSQPHVPGTRTHLCRTDLRHEEEVPSGQVRDWVVHPGPGPRVKSGKIRGLHLGGVPTPPHRGRGGQPSQERGRWSRVLWGIVVAGLA